MMLALVSWCPNWPVITRDALLVFSVVFGVAAVVGSVYLLRKIVIALRSRVPVADATLGFLFDGNETTGRPPALIMLLMTLMVLWVVGAIGYGIVRAFMLLAQRWFPC